MFPVTFFDIYLRGIEMQTGKMETGAGVIAATGLQYPAFYPANSLIQPAL
jgi:hypothetical protein